MIRKFFTKGLIAAALGVLGLAATLCVADDAVVVQDCCQDACCRKVCQPTVEKKKVTKRVYADSCEDFCLPKCSLFGCLFGHSSCCDEGCADCKKCEHPRTRKYLLVKVREHEECENKCIVVQECCPATPCVQSAPCAAPAQAIPAPAVKPVGYIEYRPGMPLTR